jgi:hypothetical protein
MNTRPPFPNFEHMRMFGLCRCWYEYGEISVTRKSSPVSHEIRVARNFDVVPLRDLPQVSLEGLVIVSEVLAVGYIAPCSE